MANKYILLAVALLCSLQSIAQRSITSLREVAIDPGLSLSGRAAIEPDIIYTMREDSTFEALRLSVLPPSGRIAETQPYLNMNSPESIRVNWKAARAYDDAKVRFGSSPGRLVYEVVPEIRKLDWNYFWYTAHLPYLLPDHVYYYQVSYGGADGEIYHFRTMPENGDKSKMRVLLIGDHQRSDRADYEWLIKAAQRTVRERYGDGEFIDHIRFLLNVGDQVDYGPMLYHYEKEHFFKSRLISPMLSNMTAVGNHEYMGDETLRYYDAHYHEYGNLEYRGIRSNTSAYYAYQVGSALFVILDSERPSPEQKLWVRSVVDEASGDDGVEFIVSVQHTPLYAEQSPDDVSLWMRDEIMPILSSTPKHVLNCSGHHHLYARGQMTDSPLYHIITGGGVGTSADNYEQLWGNEKVSLNLDEVQKTIDQWTYQILEFDPSEKTMRVDCYSLGNSRLALDNVLIDSFTRRLDVGPGLPRPAVVLDADTVELPYTFLQAPGESIQSGDIHSARYQIAADSTFSSLLVDRVITAEDLFGVADDFLPHDLNKGRDLTCFEVGAGDLPGGRYFIRVTNRDDNLQWSEFSEPAPFCIDGAASSVRASINIGGSRFRPDSEISLTYAGVPVSAGDIPGKTDRELSAARVAVFREGVSVVDNDPEISSEITDKSGVLNFKISQTGVYYAVIVRQETEISPRTYFIVCDNCDEENLPAMTTDRLVYEVGEPVTVNLANAPCLPGDTIGVYPASTAEIAGREPLLAAPAGDDSGAAVTLPTTSDSGHQDAVLADGIYFAAYRAGEGMFEPLERCNFIVGRPVSLYVADKMYLDGDEIKFLYDGLPDWDGLSIAIYKDGKFLLDIPMSEGKESASFMSEESGNYEACVCTANYEEISPRAAFVIESRRAAIDGAFVDGAEGIVISSGGEVRADGLIEIYSPDGKLHARGRDALTVDTPGVYVVRTRHSVSKLIVR